MTGSRSVALVLAVFAASSARSDPGREFYAVFSDTGVSWPLSILACNPDPLVSATVTVETELGVVASTFVPPESCEVALVSDSRKATGSIEDRLAYRITSDRPVYAQQFADFGVAAGTPSATRLPDRSELSTEYMVMAMRAASVATYHSVLVVVAPEPARVSVTVTAVTAAGGVVPALAAGDTYTTDLPAFGVLQLASSPDVDLTGSVVRADAPVQVFGGCSSCFVSMSATADSTLEVMPPTASWGRRIVVPVSFKTTVASNLIRILAAEDATLVTTDPPQAGTPTILSRGEFLDLVTTADFVIDGSGRVLVGRVEGRGMRDPSDRMGDPALVLLQPAEHFIRSATFALSDFFNLIEEWLDVVTYPGANVVVDGVPVLGSSFVAIGSSGYVHSSIPLSFGRNHSVFGDQPLAAYASARYAANAVSYSVDVGCQMPSPPEISRAAAPLWPTRRSTDDVLFSWEDLGSAATGYNLYTGTIGAIWDHTGLACALGGTSVVAGRREAVLTIPGDHYFLMSASNCGGEGPTGGDPARSDCPP